MSTDITSQIEDFRALAEGLLARHKQQQHNKVWLVSYIDPKPDCEETVLGIFDDRDDVDAIIWWFGWRAYAYELTMGSLTMDCLDALTAWQTWHVLHETAIDPLIHTRLCLFDNPSSIFTNDD